jgi:hypothetical protein
VGESWTLRLQTWERHCIQSQSPFEVATCSLQETVVLVERWQRNFLSGGAALLQSALPGQKPTETVNPLGVSDGDVVADRRL